MPQVSLCAGVPRGPVSVNTKGLRRRMATEHRRRP